MENAIWGLVGILVGSALTGLIQFLMAKLQLDYREREQRLTRLIATREKYLIPLREAMAEWVRYSRLWTARMVILGQEREKAKTDPNYYKNLYDDFSAIMDKHSEVRLTMDVSLSQVGDLDLYKKIQEMREQTGQADSKIIPMLSRLDKAKDKMTLDEMNEITKQMRALDDKIHDLLIPINHRIEILLSGEDS
jgi:hypothetical protein